MKQDHPTITVVVAAYNEEKYIPKLLTSLNNQTYKNFDVIIVDNNSTDNTAQLAKKYGAHVLKEERQGYVFTLNTGMQAAKGDIIAVTDADTAVPADWLEKISTAFEDKNVVGIGGSLRYKDSNFLFNHLSYPIYTAFMKLHFTLGKPHLTGSSMAVRRNAFEKIGGLDLRYEISADVDLGLRLKKYGKVLFRPEITVVTSARRFKKHKLQQFLKYGNAYIMTVWFSKAPKGSLKAIR